MAEIGLFPLEMVLLPSERMPLHIFEPRYKELIGECLADELEFGLVLADERGLRNVGTRAAVTEVLERFPDGRLNILVEGRERFRVVELTSGRPFQTAEVEAVEDEPRPARPQDAERAASLLQELAGLTGNEIDEPDLRAEQLSFKLAAHVDFGVDREQQLLELRSERERMRALAGLLEQAVATVRIRRELTERAAGNGKVSGLEED
jgi:ATP-dependent Lon protease